MCSLANYDTLYCIMSKAAKGPVLLTKVEFGVLSVSCLYRREEPVGCWPGSSFLWGFPGLDGTVCCPRPVSYR